MSLKQELNKLEHELYEQRNNPGMESLREYLAGNLDEVKSLLTTCHPEELGVLQGQARVYSGLLKTLTQPPFDISSGDH